MRRVRKQRVKIRIPVPSKPEKTMRTTKDVLEEEERHKSTAEYLKEYEEELESEENGEDDD
jgi:hypothetical protein